MYIPNVSPYDHYNVTYNNLWSANNIRSNNWNNDLVVKTVYDPCPAGFHVPAGGAFTGFTTDGQNYGPANASGAWDWGWNFNNKITSPDATVYFPAMGMRNIGDGLLYNVGWWGDYWSAVPNDIYGCNLWFSPYSVNPQNRMGRANGMSVRPVAEPKTRVTPKVPGSTEEDWSNNEDIDGGEIEI